jgi:outer membrane protein TolC
MTVRSIYVDQALRYNSDVLIARERVNEYQARAYAADSSLFPSLDASLTGTRARRSPPPPACRPQHGVQRRLTASYDVDIWGANRSAASAAKPAWRRKSRCRRGESDRRLFGGRRLRHLLSLDEQLRVTQQTLKSREDAFNLAKRQFETGYTSRLELMQADSELRSTRAQIPPLQHQIAQQENALSLLLGANPAPLSATRSRS